MKVFISWSGTQSKQIAEALREWLPMAIQAVRPYMSEQDNDAGARWGAVVATELESSDFGIICLTGSNLDSRWINFEAGALSKAVEGAHVVPLLFELSNADVGPPLSQFMMKGADKDGMLGVLKSINGAVENDRQLDQASLLGIFEALWPQLESKLQAVLPESDPTKMPPHRTERELLEEVLGILRANARVSKVDKASIPLVPNSVMDELRSLAGPNGHVEVSGDRVILHGTAFSAPWSERTKTQLKLLNDVLKAFGQRLYVSRDSVGEAASSEAETI